MLDRAICHAVEHENGSPCRRLAAGYRNTTSDGGDQCQYQLDATVGNLAIKQRNIIHRNVNKLVRSQERKQEVT